MKKKSPKNNKSIENACQPIRNTLSFKPLIDFMKYLFRRDNMVKCMKKGGGVKKGAVELKDKGAKGYAAGGAAKSRKAFPMAKPVPKKK